MDKFIKTVNQVKLGERQLVVIGLGYVGLQLACAFADKGVRVVGLDVDANRVDAYRSGVDPTGSVDPVELNGVEFVNSTAKLNPATVGVYIVCVPTPVDDRGRPVYNFVTAATETVSTLAKPGDIVVYESTVGPGTTAGVCASILAKRKLRPDVDVAVGFSPERLQPGRGGSRTTDLPKVVGADKPRSLEAIVELYSVIIDRARLHPTASTTTAELAKLLENVKRDVNIALVNEFAKICDHLGVNVQEVIDLAETKPNFVNAGYRPGLVGGHCISVDPHFLYPAIDDAHVFSSIVKTARHVNELHPHWVAKRFAEIVRAATPRRDVTVLGATFKENCPDLREAKVWETVATLRDVYGFTVTVVDPIVDVAEASAVYGQPVHRELPDRTAAVLVAVAHDEFRHMLPQIIARVDEPRVIVDLKNVYASADVSGCAYRRL